MTYTPELYDLMLINHRYLVMRDNANSDLYLVKDNPKVSEEYAIASTFYVGKYDVNPLEKLPDGQFDGCGNVFEIV